MELFMLYNIHLPINYLPQFDFFTLGMHIFIHHKLAWVKQESRKIQAFKWGSIRASERNGAHWRVSTLTVYPIRRVLPTLSLP